MLAIPYSAIDDVTGAYGDQLSNKVVVDITNPVDLASFTLLQLQAGSAAAEIAHKAPGARVVKAFNTTFAGTLADGTVAGQPLDVCLPSDDDGAKDIVRRLVRTPACAPSTPARSAAHANWKRSATCTRRSNSHSAPDSPAASNPGVGTGSVAPGRRRRRTTSARSGRRGCRSRTGAMFESCM